VCNAIQQSKSGTVGVSFGVVHVGVSGYARTCMEKTPK